MRIQFENPDFFKENRKAYLSKTIKGSLSFFSTQDEMHRNGDQTFRFRPNSDFFYLTGINQEKSLLMLFPDCPNPDLREVLFLVEPNESMEIWYGHKLTKDEAKQISGIENIKWLSSLEACIHEAMYFTNDVYLGFSEHSRFKADADSRALRFGRSLTERYPAHHYHRADSIIAELRKVKNNAELELIKTACSITEKAFRRVLKTLKPGMFEYEIEAEITHEFIRNRSNGHAYNPIVASGINACILHYIENKDECKDGDLLLLDFGAEYNYYAADLSRTLPVNGKFTPRQKQCYNAVLNAFKYAKSIIKPGKTIADINKEVGLFLEKEMIKLGLFTKNDVKNQNPANPLYTKYFMHGVSHFLGLDVHDSGTKFEPLQPGNVITCEPGLYIKEEGIGIRLENDLLITKNGNSDLMKDIPIETDDIENLMKQR